MKKLSKQSGKNLKMNTKIIYEAVYNMLILANTRLDLNYYEKIKNCDSKIKNEILKNAYLAYKSQRPLCQDTGQVVVFIKIGQEVKLEGDFIEDAINKAIKDCYTDNFYRKSVVYDAIFNRENTNTNTPSVIHTKLQKGDEISILIGIKGGGAENMTKLKMMNPTSTLNDVLDFAKEAVIEAGESACPPMTIGIGAGGTAEVAAINAKYALFKGKKVDFRADNVLEAKIITSQTHIASLPVCININCHSLRHMECVIKNDEIIYDFKNYIPEDNDLSLNYKKVSTDNIEEIKKLKDGEEILLSGKIYTGRDMAHLRMIDVIKNNKELPFELKNAIIFYAGPCPKKEGEIIGPVGPTTSKRMDKFAPELYEKGVLATIGKGDRTIKNTGYLYLKAIGGVACLYQKCVKKAEIKAYEDLGAEAVYELEVVDMPLKVNRI